MSEESTGMTDDVECVHGITKAWCAHCAPRSGTELVEDRVLGRWFTAAFPGRCSDCDDLFDVGDRIQADGRWGYLGNCCGEEFHDG
jgi:hypothetical protein